MFIQDIQESGVPDLNATACTFNKRSAYRQKLRDDLRRRFRKEYLGQLTSRNPKSRGDLKVGDMVFVGSDNTKRINWPLGKVLEVTQGKDDVVRVAKVKTSHGELTRPVQRLYPLELSTEHEASEKTSEGLKPLSPKSCVSNKGVKKEDEPEKIVEVKTRFGRVIRKPEKLGS